MVERDHADNAELIGDIDHDATVLPQKRYHVAGRRFPPIHFAVLQRGRGCGCVRHHDPFGAVYQHPLAASEPGGGFLPRHVISECLEHCSCPRHPFASHEAHRPRADIVGDLTEWVGRGDPRRHDKAARRCVLAQRQPQLREGLAQYPAEGAVIDGGEFVLDSLDHVARRIAHRPAFDAGDRVAREHRLAVMEFETRPQAESPGEPVRRHLFGFDHLTLQPQLVVDTVQHIVDQRPGIAHHIGRSPDGIEIGQVLPGHKAQRARRGALRDGGNCKARGGRGGRHLQECPAVHRATLALMRFSRLSYLWS